jgi:hypothetical protein
MISAVAACGFLEVLLIMKDERNCRVASPFGYEELKE